MLKLEAAVNISDTIGDKKFSFSVDYTQSELCTISIVAPLWPRRRMAGPQRLFSLHLEQPCIFTAGRQIFFYCSESGFDPTDVFLCPEHILLSDVHFFFIARR